MLLEHELQQEKLENEIGRLQAQLAERDAIMKNLATGIEIVLFTPDLPLMRCEIEGLKKSLSAYKAPPTQTEKI